jgi:hypothetical protein
MPNSASKAKIRANCIASPPEHVFLDLRMEQSEHSILNTGLGK